jgi:rhodanese-related sulfurtransferase
VDDIQELEIAPETVDEDPDRYTILDVRKPGERKIAALEDDLWIQMGQLPDSLDDLENIEEPIVVYCHHGIRSLKVTSFLRDEGFDEVYSLAGGIDAWAKKIDPSLATY